MLLTIDVGNTNITFGIFDKKTLVTTFRMTTKQLRTSDEYGVSVIDMLERNQISKKEIENVITASVVPNVMHSLEGAVIKYLNIRPIVIEPGTKTGIRWPVMRSSRRRLRIKFSRCVTKKLRK